MTDEKNKKEKNSWKNISLQRYVATLPEFYPKISFKLIGINEEESSIIWNDKHSSIRGNKYSNKFVE